MRQGLTINGSPVQYRDEQHAQALIRKAVNAGDTVSFAPISKAPSTKRIGLMVDGQFYEKLPIQAPDGFWAFMAPGRIPVLVQKVMKRGKLCLFIGGSFVRANQVRPMEV